MYLPRKDDHDQVMTNVENRAKLVPDLDFGHKKDLTGLHEHDLTGLHERFNWST